jgi:8-oxo-dGTP diphosphatase
MEHTPLHIVAVTALIRNANGEVLLVRTLERGWEPPGGQVEQGETLIDAAVREIKEEAGIDARISTLAAVYSNVQRCSVIFAFLGDYISGDLATSEETVDVRWVRPESVLPMITHRPTFDRTYDLLNFDNRVVYRAYSADPYTVVDNRVI